MSILANFLAKKTLKVPVSDYTNGYRIYSKRAAKHVVEVCAGAGISCMTQIADVQKNAVEDAFDQGYTAVVLGSDLFILWKWAADVKLLMDELR